jgi:sirohydrochlorin ferrochelatase
MKGVLVIAHGSREKDTETYLREIVDTASKNLNVHIEHAFMQFGEKTIESAIFALAQKKVTEIKIVPYFLFMGIHMKEDIPSVVGECMKNYPEIKTIMGEPLGSDKQSLAKILAGKIKD